MSNYPELEDDEKTYFDWRTATLRFACCDCGLVHDIEFVPRGAKSYVTFKRENRATGQLRRHQFGGLQKGGKRYRIAHPWTKRKRPPRLGPVPTACSCCKTIPCGKEEEDVCEKK